MEYTAPIEDLHSVLHLLQEHLHNPLPLPKGIEGEIEIDESYITAGLKGRNNSEKIKELGRKPRKRGLKRRGRGRYQTDRPPIIALILRGGYRMVFSAQRAKLWREAVSSRMSIPSIFSSLASSITNLSITPRESMQEGRRM